MRDVRGNAISMIFQEPMTSLNPVYTCGDQIAEAISLHEGISRARGDATGRSRCSGQVGIPDAKRRAKQYPHQLSGGMRQRVMIAMALSTNPELLIADEPTTALDVTIQAQILELMKALRERNRMAIMLITHDLGVVAEMADDVVVMYAGKVVEARRRHDRLRAAAPPVHEGPAGVDPADGRAARSASRSSRASCPNPLNLPDGLPLQAALPVRDADLRHAAAAPGDRAAATCRAAG